ncbi:hypothetical protein PtA15_1A309 [Puccinia triticina]|uniref:Rho-GAP domain-containing protein n=1 Tax=Puccinia triticina TaxID=208348 RepID=A0ABY7C763_9BASI|nr:uncharacterized protein PtA15_1A309 [Puccinia triticina]WAQ80971.1 hypothetical protein PtA15_1A309 [Puccinia triticina]
MMDSTSRPTSLALPLNLGRPHQQTPVHPTTARQNPSPDPPSRRDSESSQSSEDEGSVAEASLPLSLDTTSSAHHPDLSSRYHILRSFQSIEHNAPGLSFATNDDSCPSEIDELAYDGSSEEGGQGYITHPAGTTRAGPSSRKRPAADSLARNSKKGRTVLPPDGPIIFTEQADPLLLQFTAHLGFRRAEVMLGQFKRIVFAFPDNPGGHRHEQRAPLRFARYGLWVGEWVSAVSARFPQFFLIPTSYLDNGASHINKEKLLALVGQDSSDRPPLAFCEALFLRVAEGFVKLVRVKEALAHTIYISMLVSSSKKPYEELPSALRSYTDIGFFQALVARIRSMLSCITGLQQKVRGSDSTNMSALACFAVGGVRGLLLGPPSDRICTPSGAAQHIALIAMGTTHRDPEPYWHKTHTLILRLLRSSFADHRLADLNEVHLADALASDFLHVWSATGEPVPWLKPRARKAVRPPNIDLNNL